MKFRWTAKKLGETDDARFIELILEERKRTGIERHSLLFKRCSEVQSRVHYWPMAIGVLEDIATWLVAPDFDDDTVKAMRDAAREALSKIKQEV